MSEPIVSDKFLAAVVAVLALLSAIAYAILAGAALVEVWGATGDAPQPSEPFTYIETALAGLVGGIVATAFGVSPPPQKLGGLSNISTAGASTRQWIGAVYVMVFFAVGIAAVVTWLVRPEVTSVLVKNIAVVMVGMVIPIVAGFFARPTR